MVTLRHWPVCNRTPSVPALDLSCTAPAAPSVPCASHSHHLSVTALSLRHLSCADNHVQFLNSFHVMFCDYCFRLSYTWKVPKSSNWMPTGHMPRKQWRTSGFFGTSWHGWELAHGLVKIHESEELRGSLWGRGETISFDQGLAHRSCTNLSYQRCGRRQLISKAAQIEGVFMLFRHIAYFYIGKCTADPSRSPPLKKSPLSQIFPRSWSTLQEPLQLSRSSPSSLP